MAGPVTPPCHAIRAELTELLLLDRPLPTPLDRHLAKCAECSAEMAGVRRVIRTFERADPPLAGSGSGLGPGFPAAGRRGAWCAPAPAHGARSGEVSGADGPKSSRSPGGRVRRRGATAVAGVVLAACAVLTTVVVGDERGESAAAVTLSRKKPMIEHSWGTEVPVSLSGLRPGETYHLMAGDAQGRRQSAGSVRAGEGDASLRARMVTAMPRSAITTLLVQDERGRMLARLPVTPPGTPSPSSPRTPPTADD